jgi:hypothetical protein
VAASVEQPVERSVPVSRQDDRPESQIRELEVVGLRQLALMPEISPGPTEYSNHLIGEHTGIGIGETVNPTSLNEA